MGRDKTVLLTPPAGRPSKEKSGPDKEKASPGLNRQVAPTKGKMRLNLDIDIELHTRLKVYAAQQHKSIADIIRNLLDTLEL